VEGCDFVALSPQAAYGEALPFPMNHWVPWRAHKAAALQYKAHSAKQVGRLWRHGSFLATPSLHRNLPLVLLCCLSIKEMPGRW